MKLCVFAVLATAAAFCGNPSCSGCPGCQGLVVKTATKAVGAAALGTSAVHKSNVAALLWLLTWAPDARVDLRTGADAAQDRGVAQGLGGAAPGLP